ncbi:MAG: hypothetical protein L6R28_18235 [Planctomycetes bacterium]|nr:hypothetical protein [Planctomycetota bacterium]
MSTGKGKIAAQKGARGIYAEIELEVLPVQKESVEVDHCYISGWTLWGDAVREGTQFAAEYARGVSQHSGFRVKVLDIRYNPVESTDSAVSYVTALAMYSALKIPPDPEYRFDAKDLTFHKPKQK